MASFYFIYNLAAQREFYASLCIIPISSLFNSVLNNNIVDCSKLKAHADNKITVSEKLKFVLGREENIVEKGENAGHQHFLLFPQCFQKASCTGSLKGIDVWKRDTYGSVMSILSNDCVATLTLTKRIDILVSLWTTQAV